MGNNITYKNQWIFRQRTTPRERKAALYLYDRGINLNTDRIRKFFNPDFEDMDGNQYEIKSLMGKNIQFTKFQYENFTDKVLVLIFEAFKRIPTYILTMKQIRKLEFKEYKKYYLIKIVRGKNGRKQ